MNLPEQIIFTAFPGAAIEKKIEELTPDNVCFLVDENTEKLCLNKLAVNFNYQVIKISSGEKEKNIDTCVKIWKELTEYNCTRKSCLINLGGGVIGDMGGFAASTYKRGIGFINVPTTLLSQVDASIGGKLGIDFYGYKNHIGLFNEPKVVIVSPQFLETLPHEQILSGYAEIIKHALISDSNHWSEIKKINDVTDIKWDDFIERSIQLKNKVVNSDPFESGPRKILNFGHTLGHAIETWKLNNNNPTLHGIAIAAGMILETDISEKLGLLGKNESLEIIEYIKRIYPKVELPRLEKIIELAKQDKKNTGKEISFSLLKSIGTAVYDVQVPDDTIKEAYLQYELLYK
jgi:3-dehydroquinate synthase